METERLLKWVNQEIKQRGDNRDIKMIKSMSDLDLLLFKSNLEKMREEEYKKIGWLKK